MCMTKTVSNNDTPDPYEGLENIAELHRDMNKNIINTYWKIGILVNSMYENELSAEDFTYIAFEIGIGKDTLMKACRFADKYSQEHLQRLLNFKNTVDWYLIANSLIFDADNTISQMEYCKDSDSYYKCLEKRLLPFKNAKIYTQDTYTTGYRNILKVHPINDDDDKEYKSLEEENEALRNEINYKNRVIYINDRQNEAESSIMADYTMHIRRLQRDLLAIRKVILKGGTIDEILPFLVEEPYW